MIKRKVKPRKRKNPYRKQPLTEHNYINIEKLRFIYQIGYLHGLIDGLKKVNLKDWEISKLNFEYYTFDNKNYYKVGYYQGLNDSKEQLKLISTRKIKNYIEELEHDLNKLLVRGSL